MKRALEHELAPEDPAKTNPYIAMRFGDAAVRIKHDLCRRDNAHTLCQ